MRRYALFALLVVSPWLIDSTMARGVAAEREQGSTITVNGRKINYKIVGTYSKINQSENVVNGEVVLALDLDGAQHKITVDETKVTWNSMKWTFPSVSVVDIQINKAAALIKVNGRQIHPAPKPSVPKSS